MVPIYLPVLALAGRTLLSKYSPNKTPEPGKTKIQFKLRPGTGDRKTFTLENPIKAILERVRTGVNPIGKVFDGLSSAVSQITKKTVREDYNTLIKDVIPANAKLITPQYPQNSRGYQLFDMDGVPGGGLAASYSLDGELKTIVLKKQKEQWQKAFEISHTGYDTVQYSGAADVYGNGKKQLLLGLKAIDSTSRLYAYTFDSNNASQIFSHNYDRFEVLKQTKASKASFAFWNKRDTDAYDVNILSWNNSQLEPVRSTTGYYMNSVIPYYAGRLKQTPYSPSNWYNLADALVKTGIHGDALTAIQAGMGVDRKSLYKDKFVALRDRVLKA